MNSINIIGRLTEDITLNATTTGISVCSFTVAVRRPHSADKTDFIRCVAWNSTAENIAKYFCKGKKIGLSGILTSRNYEDADGNKMTKYEVVVESFCYCEKKEKLVEEA